MQCSKLYLLKLLGALLLALCRFAMAGKDVGNPVWGLENLYGFGPYYRDDWYKYNFSSNWAWVDYTVIDSWGSFYVTCYWRKLLTRGVYELLWWNADVTFADFGPADPWERADP